MSDSAKAGTIRWRVHRTGGMFVYTKAFPGASPLDCIVIQGKDKIVELALPTPADLLHLVASQLDVAHWAEPEVIPDAEV
ncbi:MAG: hypothetical protein HY815_30655 [Candidatus Riflebacteria bacterium]|nr:hypothetical protein [Candidatus Riflebacteria bacterium]